MPTGEVIDRGDGRPIAGVAVSDELAVALTGADGSFSLPDRTDAEFVWVTRNGVVCAVTEDARLVAGA